jgi:hypothetical protein
MKTKYLIFALLISTTTFFLTGCNEYIPDLELGEAIDSINVASFEQDTSELLQLCKYQYPYGDGFLDNPCEGTIFIKRLSGEGTVRYDSAINGYVVSKGFPIDCYIVTLLCGDYSDISGKEINYTCDYYEYNGFFDPPIGGMEVFVGKNMDY